MLKKIFTVAILITLISLLFSGKIVENEGTCGECKNPLVQIMNVIIAGDIPDFEKWGYMPVKPGRQDGTADNLWRGLTIFTGFKKKNPCADIYFIFEDLVTTKRVGVKEGEAKYKIETIVEFIPAEDGLMTPVKEVIGIQTELDKPKLENGRFYNYDYEIISEQDKLIPVIGQLDVTTNLVCLKNGQTYEFQNLLIDRVDDPYDTEENMLGKECPEYYMPDGSVKDENGLIHIPADGLMFGKFSPSDLSAYSIEFEKGDVGEIIRNTETPKDCRINVDYKVDYPPYFNLDITNIKNKYDNSLPNNIYIALKVEKGRLEGGKFIDGWRVFPTNEGRVIGKIRYTPPQCAISESDIIEIAQVCEDKNGKMSIGSTKFTKKINNPLCSDATLSITSRYLREIKKDRKDDDGDSKASLYIKDQSGTITLQLKKHSEINYEGLLGLHWVYYVSTSRSLNNWHIDYSDHRDEESKYHTFTYREDAEISNVKIKTPDYPIMVIIMYDTETKKAKYMIVQASLIMGYEMNITINTQSTDKNGTTTDSRTDYKKESYNFEIVGDEIHDSKLNKKFPSGALAKGSKNTFTGYGKTEEVKSLSETFFHEERKLKTSQWTMTIND